MLDYTNNAPAQPARSYFSGSNLNGGGAHSSLGHAVGYHGGSQMSTVFWTLHRRTAVLICPGLQFKPSPFYEIRRSVGPIRTCEGMNDLVAAGCIDLG